MRKVICFSNFALFNTYKIISYIDISWYCLIHLIQVGNTYHRKAVHSGCWGTSSRGRCSGQHSSQAASNQQPRTPCNLQHWTSPVGVSKTSLSININLGMDIFIEFSFLKLLAVCCSGALNTWDPAYRQTNMAVQTNNTSSIGLKKFNEKRSIGAFHCDT